MRIRHQWYDFVVDRYVPYEVPTTDEEAVRHIPQDGVGMYYVYRDCQGMSVKEAMTNVLLRYVE